MSPQTTTTMDDDHCSNYNTCQQGHPKAERAQAKKHASRSVAKRPVYPLKNRVRSNPAGRAMLGDTEAHSHDNPELCTKNLPRDSQEARGCKARDMGKRNLSWNKKVYLGVVGAAESFDSDVGPGGDLVDDGPI
ncbi:hypothetical protein VM1G_03201 [Cytospora mali]|uniref:Uncharacterized protein n=1 Tax=Cytospora mali TaxID=578113 RepID=A0A194VV56_CYTMA|nr:hypothetical protein VM1G_03201 [Valsa mali]